MNKSSVTEDEARANCQNLLDQLKGTERLEAFAKVLQAMEVSELLVEEIRKKNSTVPNNKDIQKAQAETLQEYAQSCVEKVYDFMPKDIVDEAVEQYVDNRVLVEMEEVNMSIAMDSDE